MFSVPGWSVSTADLKPQKDSVTTQGKPAQTVDNTPVNNTDTSSKSNKRKRGNGPDQNGGKITKSNVHEMFRRHIEGHTKSPSSHAVSANGTPKEGKKKRNRVKKKANNNDGENVNGDGHPVEDGNQQQNKKQKKDHGAVQQPSAGDEVENKANRTSTLTETIQPPPPTTAAALTPLQQKMREKLISARFRHLNETLYTTPSSEALELFSANPELFAEYHAGFSRQVKESWPSNPVDGYIRAIQRRGALPAAWKKHPKGDSESRQGATALPRRPNGLCTISDLGCGDAQLARALTPSAKKLKLKLLSYDLHVPDPLVTKADISALPVADGSVDIAIFCLSLMGTNWVSFVEEAWRVLRGDGKGECWVSEVKSRFGKVARKKAQIGLKRADSNAKTQPKKNHKKKRGGGESDLEDDTNDDIFAEDAHNTAGAGDGDETDISAFIEVFRSRGFTLKSESVDKSNKMFVRMEFIKQGGGAPAKGKYAGAGNAGKPFAAPGKKRFIDRENVDGKGLTPEEEAKVLKPCVYKIR